jgi:hypothetical protein
MNTFEVTWQVDDNNREGSVTFKDGDNDLGKVGIYGVYENPYVSVIGIEHNGENIYESAWSGSIDSAKNALVEKAVSYFEGYSLCDFTSAVLVDDASLAETIGIDAYLAGQY